MTPSLEGFSVAKLCNREGYSVIRDGMVVGVISSLGPYFNDVFAWEWHSERMWTYSASEFVV